MMGELFLRLLGAPPIEGGEINDATVTFQPVLPVAALVTIFVFLAVLSIWLYAKTPRDVSRPRKVVMALLRCVLFALLLVLLLRPTLNLGVEKENRRTLLGLVDSSASFNISDQQTTRLERAAAAIKDSDLLPTLEKDLDLAFYSFDKDLTELDPGAIGELEVAGGETAIGNNLRALLNKRRGEPLAGIFLVTDGVSTTGELPIDAAESLRDAGIPLYIYAEGSTAVPDLAIESVDVASASLVGDAVPVTVRVRSQGMAGKTGRVALPLAGAKAADKDVTFGEDGIAEVSLAFLPNQAGDFELAATVESPDGTEIIAENNSWTRNLRILDSRIRVLIVEESPRWEFKYIQAMLLREQRVDLDCLVFDADPEVTRTPNSPYIENFPQRREDLFKYDLVLLGDVDPRKFSQSQLESISSYVAEAGGSLAVLSGKRFTPHAYRFSSLADLLPVEPLAASTTPATRKVQLTPTSAGLKSPMLQLEDTPEESLARWKKLPPIYWTANTSRAKPAATVYLTNPLDNSPVLAMQRYGAGEVLFLGTDNTWRWRKNIGDLYHATFWGQLVQRLAGTRLLAGSRRTQLKTDRENYLTDQRITVYAKLSNTAWEPMRDDTVRATLQDQDGNRQEVQLRQIPEQPGQYRAEITAPGAGRYQLSVNSDPDSPIDITVTQPNAELDNPSMNESLLRQLAQVTDGEYFTSETIKNLPAAIINKTATLKTQTQADLWASPLIFLLIILTITAEWILRKFAELK